MRAVVFLFSFINRAVVYSYTEYTSYQVAIEEKNMREWGNTLLTQIPGGSHGQVHTSSPSSLGRRTQNKTETGPASVVPTALAHFLVTLADICPGFLRRFALLRYLSRCKT